MVPTNRRNALREKQFDYTAHGYSVKKHSILFFIFCFSVKDFSLYRFFLHIAAGVSVFDSSAY